jgi:aspartyl-tRNA(Asn)/glutamyl-tRNA(Gln) amidotransferase subunit A
VRSGNDNLYAEVKVIAEGIRAQKISPVALVEACLKRIEEANPKINAFITVLAAEARELARCAEKEIRAGKWRGPLHGVPIAIKDFYDTAGIKTTAAFEHFRDRVPAKDAVAVAKLKKAGAIIIGKANMHRLGEGTTGLDSYFGAVKNPWNPKYIPGGSSSGSSAAVASGMCYATLDTDAIGSCRLPAACCGVVGFKGTYGLISTQGILAGEQPPDETIVWLSHPGITTRSVKDTAIVLEVLAEKKRHHHTPYPLREHPRTRKLRIRVANNFNADREVSTHFEGAVETISNLGHVLNMAPVPLVGLERGVSNIKTDRRSIASQFFQDVDVYVLPTTTTIVPAVEHAGDPLALSPTNTVFANYFGLPAISLPCGFDSHGLPLGVQMVAKPWDERTLLYLAHQYQQAAPWDTNRPGL